MKGGVTSGIVYPPAISELAKRFAFRNIGGTSIGAVAAALAAAAELGRRKQIEGTFARLAAIPEELSVSGAISEIDGAGHSREACFRSLECRTLRGAGNAPGNPAGALARDSAFRLQCGHHRPGGAARGAGHSRRRLGVGVGTVALCCASHAGSLRCRCRAVVRQSVFRNDSRKPLRDDLRASGIGHRRGEIYRLARTADSGAERTAARYAAHVWSSGGCAAPGRAHSQRRAGHQSRTDRHQRHPRIRRTASRSRETKPSITIRPSGARCSTQMSSAGSRGTRRPTRRRPSTRKECPCGRSLTHRTFRSWSERD